MSQLKKITIDDVEDPYMEGFQEFLSLHNIRMDPPPSSFIKPFIITYYGSQKDLEELLKVWWDGADFYEGEIKDA